VGEESNRISTDGQKCRAHAVVNSLDEKIVELETTYADLKREKESISASNQRLSEKVGAHGKSHYGAC
jgi:hypothetical protein